MPRREKVVIKPKSDTKRLYIYAGVAVPEEVVNHLGIKFDIESPAIERLTSSEPLQVPQKKKKTFNGQRYTRARLITALVHKLASRDALQVEASKFYLKHIEFFSEEVEDGTRATANVDPETYSLCQLLPYSIVGTGSTSRMYRVILYFFAVKEGLMKPPPITLRHATSEIPLVRSRGTERPPLNKRIEPTYTTERPATKLSVEPKCRKEADGLTVIFKRKRMVLIRAFIRSVASNRDQLEGVKRFYVEEYIKKEPSKGRVTLSVNFSMEELALLDHISHSVVGDANRSLTTRCIIGYFSRSGDKDLT